MDEEVGQRDLLPVHECLIEVDLDHRPLAHEDRGRLEGGMARRVLGGEEGGGKG